MRYLFVATAFIALLAAGSATCVQGAGMVAVGHEECECSPLVARGIVPDTLNQLHLAVVPPPMAVALERVAEEFRNVFGSLVARQVVASEAAPAALDEAKAPEEAPAVKKDKAPEPAKKAKKPTKKRRVKLPPRAK